MLADLHSPGVHVWFRFLDEGNDDDGTRPEDERKCKYASIFVCRWEASELMDRGGGGYHGIPLRISGDTIECLVTNVWMYDHESLREASMLESSGLMHIYQAGAVKPAKPLLYSSLPNQKFSSPTLFLSTNSK